MKLRTLKLKNKYNIDFLWSKGSNEINKYCLTATGRKNHIIYIYSQIKNCKDILFIKSGYDIITFTTIIDYLDKPVILLTTDGDGGFPSSYSKEVIDIILNNENIKNWYIQNLEDPYYHEKVKHFPIGLDLHTKGWKIGNNPMDKINYMLNLNKPKNKKLEILIDFFCTKERHIERMNSIEKLKNFNYVKILHDRKSIKEILKLYSEYEFVLSPHGGGLDCHRTWETLLVGSIPIVKTSSLDSLYDDLPVVIVKDWNECTEQNLKLWKNKFKNLTNKEYIIPKFSYKYWFNK